jgi:hypothetical protein
MESIVETINGELPVNQTSWLGFWRELKKQSLEDKDLVKIEIMDRDFTRHSHTFSLLYIKSKCFEEMLQEHFSIQEYDLMLHALHRFSPYENKLKDKLSKKLNEKYVLGDEFDYTFG